jgi:hypothetical protein
LQSINEGSAKKDIKRNADRWLAELVQEVVDSGMIDMAHLCSSACWFGTAVALVVSAAAVTAAAR